MRHRTQIQSLINYTVKNFKAKAIEFMCWTHHPTPLWHLLFFGFKRCVTVKSSCCSARSNNESSVTWSWETRGQSAGSQYAICMQGPLRSVHMRITVMCVVFQGSEVCSPLIWQTLDVWVIINVYAFITFEFYWCNNKCLSSLELPWSWLCLFSCSMPVWRRLTDYRQVLQNDHRHHRSSSTQCLCHHSRDRPLYLHVEHDLLLLPVQVS